MAAIMKEESSDVDLNGDIDDKFLSQSETESTHNSELTRTPSLQNQQDQDTTQPNRMPQKFTNCDAALGIVSIVLFYVDVATDIMLANEYFHQGNKLWFGLTTTFIVVPSIMTCIFNLGVYVANDNKRTSKYLWVTRLTMTLLMMGPVIRQIEYLYHGLKSRSKERKRFHYQKKRDANIVACNLRMFECVLEAAPQLVLQIYILTSQRQHESWHIEGRQVAAILSSFVGLAWSLVAFEKADRLFVDKDIHTLKGLVFIFLWRACEIGPRVIALGLFASQFRSFVFILAGVHWIAMSIWLFFQETQFYQNRSVERLFDLLCGILYIFCFLDVRGGVTRYKMLVYYIIVVLENFIMIVFWSYFTDAKGEWFYIPTFFVMPLGLVLQLFFQFMYFRCFHPLGRGKIPFCHQKGEYSCYQYLCQDLENDKINISRNHNIKT